MEGVHGVGPGGHKWGSGAKPLQGVWGTKLKQNVKLYNFQRFPVENLGCNEYSAEL